MRTRLLGNTVSSAQTRAKPPSRKEDWKQLLRKTIQRAEASEDRRLEGLKNALVKDLAEPHLRRLGIIHDRDLQREFPVQST